MDLMSARRAIVAAQPHPVTASGSLVHFETDMAGLMEISGTGTIYVTGSNLIDDTVRFANNIEIFIGANDNGFHIPLKAGKYVFTADISTTATVYMRASNASASFFSTQMSPSKQVVSVTVPSDCVCRINFYKSGSLPQSSIGHCWLNYGETAETYEPYVGSGSASLVGRKAYKGINNVWSNSGNVTVTYWEH